MGKEDRKNKNFKNWKFKLQKVYKYEIFYINKNVTQN